MFSLNSNMVQYIEQFFNVNYMEMMDNVRRIMKGNKIISFSHIKEAGVYDGVIIYEKTGVQQC